MRAIPAEKRPVIIWSSTLLSTLIGGIAGVLSGTFGIGGGIIMVPALRLFLDMPALLAVATPLAGIIPGALSGSYLYARNKVTDWRCALIVGFAGATTAVFGALGVTRLGGVAALLGISVLLFYAALTTILSIISPREVDPAELLVRRFATTPAKKIRAVLIGIFAGLCSGFFGVGGGFVMVPLLSRFLKMPYRSAIGISLTAMVLITLPGFLAHAILGNIAWNIAFGLALGTIPGAFIGARLTLGANERTIKIGFAILLCVVGAWLLANELFL